MLPGAPSGASAGGLQGKWAGGLGVDTTAHGALEADPGPALSAVQGVTGLVACGPGAQNSIWGREGVTQRLGYTPAGLALPTSAGIRGLCCLQAARSAWPCSSQHPVLANPSAGPGAESRSPKFSSQVECHQINQCHR